MQPVSKKNSSSKRTLTISKNLQVNEIKKMANNIF